MVCLAALLASEVRCNGLRRADVAQRITHRYLGCFVRDDLDQRAAHRLIVVS